MPEPKPPADLANFQAWNRAEAMTFFQGYGGHEEDEIEKIEALLWLKGPTLPSLNEVKLIDGGIPLGLAHAIIRPLQEAKILSKYGKYRF